MIGLKIVCWAYLVFTILGRIVNYDKTSLEQNVARVIDNAVIIALVWLLIIMYI